MARRATSGHRGLFDHLISPSKQRRWHGEAERLRGLEVDNQLKSSRLFEGNIGGLHAFENLVDIRACATGAASSLVPRFISPTVGDSRQTYLGCQNSFPDGQKEDNMTNNILKLAQQARTNAQLLTVSQGGIRSLTREDALKIRGDVVEAIRRLQVFEKDLAKKLDT